MSGLTTHVLDTMHGRPAAGVALRLLTAFGDVVAEAVTNNDGRCERPLVSGDDLEAGYYRLEFEIGDYFRELGVALGGNAFLETIVIEFGIDDPSEHYHVPLLVSPYAYSTYRGS